jgi:hypothetical protein
MFLSKFSEDLVIFKLFSGWYREALETKKTSRIPTLSFSINYVPAAITECLILGNLKNQRFILYSS